ncbi:MAG: hypothetical protein FJ125_07355 [Deltaproteobacteria bacterium]|nr:hypothetical protein [Deltaproteobacteria bacterium]
MSKAETRIEGVLEKIRQAYDRLFEGKDTAFARTAFGEVIGELQQIASAPSEEGERMDALHLVADLAAELGDQGLVRQAAEELARIFEPEDELELEELVEDMVTEWWSLDAADTLLGRLADRIEPSSLNALQQYVEEARAAAVRSPLTADQILTLRARLFNEGVLVESEEGFDIEEDEIDPLRRTRAWLQEQGLDVDRSLEFLRQHGQVASDAEVLLSMQPLGTYDALAHWPLEDLVRRYWMSEAEAELTEDWCSESPDGTRVAILDDNEEAAYLYVYDKSDEELVASPLWLYNRKEAPAGDELEPGAGGGAPLMPARFMLDSGCRGDEPEEVEILWSKDSSRVAVKIDGELLGFFDLETGQGYCSNLREETDVGAPWPEGMSWEE